MEQPEFHCKVVQIIICAIHCTCACVHGELWGSSATRLLILFYWIVFFFFAEKVTHLFGRSQTVLEGSKRAWRRWCGLRVVGEYSQRQSWMEKDAFKPVCVCIYLYCRPLPMFSNLPSTFHERHLTFPWCRRSMRIQTCMWEMEEPLFWSEIRDGMIQMYCFISWTNLKKIK